MRCGVVVFPGSNCDHDCYHVLKHVLGQDVTFLWHGDATVRECDLVVLPGGFSYGDYLRAGAMASLSPVMEAVERHAEEGGFVLGICNGFQMLLELGLLPGAMRPNDGLRFICRDVHVRVERNDIEFTKQYEKGQVIRLPIAHAEGNWVTSAEELDELEKEGRIVFRYVAPDGSPAATQTGEPWDDAANPNGSMADVAGLTNAEGNVLGLMPHPERCAEDILGNTDGLALFSSLVGKSLEVFE